MGEYTRYTPLPDQSYDPRVTDLRKPFNVPASTGPNQIAVGDTGTTDAMGVPAAVQRAGQWVNRNVANTTPITVVNNALVRVLPANPKRTGCVIQNLDAVQTLFFAWGNAANAQSAQIGAGGYVLFDFTTPGTELYLFTTGGANIQAVVIEMARVG